MTKYQMLYDLRSILRSLERDLGLSELSTPERDVFLAAQSLTDRSGRVIFSTDIRHHALVKDVPPATYHRALRVLLERGFLQKAHGAKAKSYVVPEIIDEQSTQTM
ncbi:MAG: hypothetical protein AAF636_17445 [Pseudomonadota bacterium]